MNDMKTMRLFLLFASLALVLWTSSCGTIKTLHVWKDDTYAQRLQKVLVIAVAENDYIRDQFENVVTERFSSRGIEAMPGHKVLPHPKGAPDREAIRVKVKELGVSSVLVARSASKKEVAEVTPGNIYVVPTNFYQDWYGFYADSFSVVTLPGRQYDAEFFTLITNIYDVSTEKLVWSYLSKVKVETSLQGAVNPFIDKLMKQLEDNKLI